MDLGKGVLRKIGINNLHCAVHPQHGVIWSDGKSIYLAPIQVEGHQVQNATSVKLGEFEHVTSVHWSQCPNGEACHLCVVHQHTVTVWRVSGALPKLSFKQVRKINVRPIAQGCLWNPCSDVLCLLSSSQCSFYFRHDYNKGSYAFPSLESGKICCGCWSPDGKKLILCVGVALLIYQWADVSISVSDFAATAWRIQGLEGRVTSISPVLKDSVVVATEIPLETLCKQQDLFKVPDTNGTRNHQDADDVIRPNSSPSATQSLFNLEQNAEATADAQSCLTLILLQDGSREPVKLSSVPLKGVLTPDILLYEKSSQCVVVGSNSHCQLHIYALLEKHLVYCGDIQLEKGQRPKGLCSMPTFFDEHGAALLILVGQKEAEDVGLPSTSTESEFKLSLKYIILKAGYNHRSRQNGRGDSIKSRSSGAVKMTGLVKSESMKEHRVKSPNEIDHPVRPGRGKQHTSSQTNCLPDEVKLPPLPASIEEPTLESTGILTHSVADHIVHKGKMIEELSDSSDPPNSDNIEVDTVPFSSQRPYFNNSKLASAYELSETQQRKSKEVINRSALLSNSSPDLSGAGRDLSLRPSGILKTNPSRQAHSSEISSLSGLPSNAVQSTNFRKEQTSITLDETDGTNRTLSSVVEGVSENLIRLGSQDNTMLKVTSISLPSGKDSSRAMSCGPSDQLPSIEEVSELNQPHREINSHVTESALPEISELNQPPRESVHHVKRVSEISEFRQSHERIVGHAKEHILSDSDSGLGTSQNSAESIWDCVERQVKSQKDSIEALQCRLEQLKATVEKTTCVFPNKYQDINKPEMVEIYCEKPEGKEIKRFLLDNGRLQLEPVKLAFGLTTVELWLDGVPCVLGCNVDGYIPMKFFPSTQLHISGLPMNRYSDPKS